MYAYNVSGLMISTSLMLIMNNDALKNGCIKVWKQ